MVDIVEEHIPVVVDNLVVAHILVAVVDNLVVEHILAVEVDILVVVVVEVDFLVVDPNVDVLDDDHVHVLEIHHEDYDQN